MRFSLDIEYPFQHIEDTRQRMLARERLEYVDRAPVLFCLAPRYFARALGFNYGEFLSDVETPPYPASTIVATTQSQRKLGLGAKGQG